MRRAVHGHPDASSSLYTSNLIPGLRESATAATEDLMHGPQWVVLRVSSALFGSCRNAFHFIDLKFIVSYF